MGTVINIRNLYYFVFKYFWFIVICPKPVQLFVFLSILFFILKMNFCIKKDSFFIVQLLAIGIYAFSIILSIIRFPHENSRIYASFNTFLITLIALFFYIVYSNTNLDIKKIGKYCYINMLILFFLLIIYIVFPNKDIFHINGNYLYALDFLDGEQTTRFIGFFSYANLVSFFVLVNTPFILFKICRRKRFRMILLLGLGYVLVFFANSRTGQALILLMISIYFFSSLRNKIQSQDRKIFCIMVAIITTVLLFIILLYFSSVITDIFEKRSDSNSMRMIIYERSIDRMINNSPFIGMGVKDLIGNSIYPYGSHSSFIGYLYKVGILGSILFVSSYCIKIVEFFKDKCYNIVDIFFKSSYVCILLWMFFEDIDGANWSIIYFYITIGIITNIQRQKREKEYE